jgi:hypothetical protein
MKKTIPFELFAPNQTIYFDILRLAEFEKVVGMPITDIVRKGDAGVSFCLAGLQVGMKHHYHKATADIYAEKIEKYLDDGGSIDDIAMPIIKAIMASGVFGKEVTEKVEEKIAEAERIEKNV